MDFLSNMAGELIVGFVLLVFGWAFGVWAKTIRSTSERILSKIEDLANDVHANRLKHSERLTRLETRIDGLETNGRK